MIKKLIPILAYFLCIIFGAILLGKSMDFQQPKRIMAVQVQDGRLLFGELNGKTLCNYFQVNIHVDPKTKKQIPSVDRGGASYGGDGCVTLYEPILWTEPLTTTSQLYTQLSQH